MHPFDKFGSPIYSTTYTKMLNYARVLAKHGYVESTNKPNLFFSKDLDNQTTFFADMRGTEEIPPWQDPSPLLYAQFPSNMPPWKQRRLFQNQYNQLRICRISYYEEFEPDGILFGNTGDGYCTMCGKDFQDEGHFCCPECQQAASDIPELRCRVCGKPLLPHKIVRHHFNYTNDKTIEVCQSCHLKIHRGSNLSSLKPPDLHLRAARQRVNANHRRIRNLTDKVRGPPD